MTKKHTPGPWAAEVDSDGTWIGPWLGRFGDPYDGAKPILTTNLIYVDRKDKATLEDCYLVAAAPELLALCEEVVAVYESETGGIEDVDIHALRAVIAKARGGA